MFFIFLHPIPCTSYALPGCNIHVWHYIKHILDLLSVLENTIMIFNFVFRQALLCHLAVSIELFWFSVHKAARSPVDPNDVRSCFRCQDNIYTSYSVWANIIYCRIWARGLSHWHVYIQHTVDRHTHSMIGLSSHHHTFTEAVFEHVLFNKDIIYTWAGGAIYMIYKYEASMLIHLSHT